MQINTDTGQARSSVKKLCQAQCILVFLPTLLLFVAPSSLIHFWLDFSRTPAETAYLIITFTVPYITLAAFYVLLYIARRTVLRMTEVRFRPPWWFYLCHLAGIGLFVCGVFFLPAL